MKKSASRFLLMAVLFLCSAFVFGQTSRNVTGVVRDASGTGIPGVSVSQKGSNTLGVISDDNGQFSITVTTSNAILVFSSIGFETKEVAVGSSNTINVSLDQAQNELSEVVVTALGVPRQTKSLGYATATVKAEDITRAGSPNFATALYGKAPGVRIGATPGGATSAININIRGLNTITGKTQPLIVLDGVPIRNEEVNNSNYWGDQRIRGNGLLDINPEDIDNLSILKGASAAALYGSEAVNGVVLITTKKGKKGVKGFTVDVNANYNQDRVAFLPRYQSVRGYGYPLNYVNGGQDAEGFIYYDTDGDGIKETRGTLDATINFGPKFDGQPIMSWDGVIRPYEVQENGYKNLFQDANSSSFNVAVSHVSDNSNIRFSLTRQSNEGISPGSENFKNIANFNSTFNFGKKYSVDLMVNYINQQTNNRPYSVDRLTNNFTGMIGRFDNGDWYENKYKTSMGYRYVTGTNQSLTPDENIIRNGFKNDLMDYVWRLYENQTEEKSNRVIASITNNWQIINDLRLRARISTDFTSMLTESRNSTERPLAFGNSGYFGLSSYNNTILYGDVLLTYNKQITPDVELNVMGGYTATSDKTTSLSRGTSGGLSTENLFDIAASVNTPGSGSSRQSLIRDALIGTINGSYKGYLFLEGTIRRDRTSTMSPNNNAFIYPSVNSSFVISEAFQLPAFISYSKLRASWGIVGNYPDPYRANIAYNQNTLGNQGGGQPVLYTTIPGSFGNDGIRPEEKHEIEFGLETQFFNRRLGLDFTYYNGQIVDQILPLTLPSTSGAGSVLTNIGTLRNKGIEIGLSGTPFFTPNFSWEIGLNLMFNDNRVEKLAPGLDQLLHADFDGNAAQLVSRVGQPMGDFLAHPVATNDKGEMIVDPNGLYKVDPDTLVRVGNAMAKFIGGLNNSFRYKRFALDVVMDFRYGGYIMPTAINWMISRGLLEESLNFMDAEHGGISYYETPTGRVRTDAAQGPSGETVYDNGKILDGVKIDGTPNDYIVSNPEYYNTVYNWGGPQYSPNTRYELYIQKNSYIKMREVSLGYDLPASIISKIGAKKLQLSVFGRNLFYVYRTLKDLDAEQTTAGSRWTQTLTNVGTNPSTRSFGVMLRASF
ncbi:MAG TPA: SusC/RagA family TonB-linked outer membrane protein [Agriterribacter sp.]|nr:SusC/RagA family TonB-linked outer membrane protein [Agriterribacter sp.]